jgi:hypothetical protein
MPAASNNLLVEQGATFAQEVTWLADDVAVNLTGYTARMMLRPSAASETITITLTTENGRITLGGTAGTIDLLISAADTAAITAGRYLYDLELISAGGIVTRLIQGIATVSAEITRGSGDPTPITGTTSRQMTSASDGSVWQESIDAAGVVSWRKIS